MRISREEVDDRRSEILDLVLKGKTNPEISELVGCKESTVKRYVGELLKENGAKTREELIVKVLGGDEMLEDWDYKERESGRSETLIKAIEKIESLEKKLNLALSCIKDYADEDNWTGHNDSSADIWCGPRGIDGFRHAQKTLKEIEEC